MSSGAGHRRLHLIFRKHSAGVGDGGAFLPGSAGGNSGGPMGGVDLAFIVTREGEDLGLEVGKLGHANGGVGEAARKM